jgi:hypothetical protein
MAYVYGRFMLAGDTTLNLFSGPDLSFEIRCRDGRTYEIAFNRSQPLQIIPIKPGICQIEDVVYEDASGKVSLMYVVVASTIAGGIAAGALSYGVAKPPTPRRMSSFRLLQNEELQPGGVYYVGDFTFYAKDNRSSTDRRYEWTSQIQDNYAGTTAAMKTGHKGFARAPTENRMSR